MGSVDGTMDRAHDELGRFYFSQMWAALGGAEGDAWQDRLTLTSRMSWRSPFGVTDLGAGALAAAGTASAELFATCGDEPRRFSVDRALVSQWFSNASSRLVDPVPPRSSGSEVSGDYETADDRWIRFQANYKALREATLIVLDCGEDRRSIAEAVRAWNADELEAAVIDGGGAVAASRSLEEWQAHPQERL